MNLLLDTHAVLWTLADDPRLGKKAYKLVKQAKPGMLAMSDVTLLEIALLVNRGRFSLEGSLRTLLDEACAAFRVLPIEPAIAVKSMEFELDQADPFDRIIAATAWHHRMALLTRDARLTRCPEIETVW
jgi:PIN domain nuclease of toxin-antitoxin system